MEFDAIARFLQDVGNDDTDDAGFGSLGLAWVARRARIVVTSAPQAREDLSLSTWCSGTGRRWAERRTTMTSERGALIEAATVWIHLDPTSGKPIPWGDAFAETYLPASKGRQVDARLRLPKSADVPASASWQFRKTDSDAFGHVNNAAYLAIAEQFFDLSVPSNLLIEWRAPCLSTDDLQVAVDGDTLWVIDATTGDTRVVMEHSAPTD